jgi:hypothetical protein
MLGVQMKRAMSICLVGLLLICCSFTQAATADQTAEKKSSKKAQSHRVAVCYFHRTKRCPTCKKIGALVEKSIDKAFQKNCKKAGIEVHMIDFQAEKNKAYAESYKIKGPTLVVLDIRKGKVKQWKTLPKIWQLVGNEDEFKKYVRSETLDYADAKEL